LKRNFLIVASDGQVRESLAGILRARGYSVTLAANGAEAEGVVRNVTVDAALIETHLDDTPAEDLKRRLLQVRPNCRVVLLTSFEQVRNSPEQLRFGAGDFLLHSDQLLDIIRAPFEGGEADEGSFARRGTDSLIEVIGTLVALREVDDRFFSGSSHQTMQLARGLAEEMSGEEQAVQEIVIAALLRDIGTSTLDPELTQEEGDYSPEQRIKMQEHVQSSLDLLEHIDFPWKVLSIIRHHHEAYDGSGYPDGLRGREIPMGARILSVVDAYVAMTSDRRHRGALAPEAALKELILKAGHQFDPEVVELFQKVLAKRRGSRPSNKKPRVLIAESQNDFRRMLKLRLSNQGFDVVEATTYEAALERILKKSPDLVLVDADADTSEAFQLLQELREDANLCRLPFVLLSRSNDRLLKLRALRGGVDEFLSKSGDVEELMAHIENIVVREEIRRGKRQAEAHRGIKGDLAELCLPDLVHMLNIGMKTACITLTSNKSSGKLWFENGTPKHALVGSLEGEEAFYDMVRWRTGEFVIEHGVKARSATLVHDATFLLMEGLRRMDEASEAASAAS